MHWGKEKMAGGGIARHAPLEEVDKRESEVVLEVQAVVMPGQMVPPLPFRNAVNYGGGTKRHGLGSGRQQRAAAGSSGQRRFYPLIASQFPL